MSKLGAFLIDYEDVLDEINTRKLLESYDRIHELVFFAGVKEQYKNWGLYNCSIYSKDDWGKYDPVTAREMLKQLGGSERLYHLSGDIVCPATRRYDAKGNHKIADKFSSTIHNSLNGRLVQGRIFQLNVSFQLVVTLENETRSVYKAQALYC